MSSDIVRSIIRFVVLILLQILVFRQINPSGSFFFYVSFIIYPLFILLLPFRTSPILLMLLAFVIGIIIDISYGSYGVHASAAVFIAFLRPTVLRVLEPRSGYNITQAPTKTHYGITWFISYSAVLMFAYLLWYFSVEAFTFVYFGQILLKTILSFLFSMLIIIVYMFIFDPKE